MFQHYKESYDYIKSQAVEIKNVITENKLGFSERFSKIPGFLSEGFGHIQNVHAIFPLFLLKIILMLAITGISCLATYYVITHINTALWASSITTDGSQQNVETVIDMILFTLIWLPYLALILLLEGLFNGAIGAATYLYEEKRPVTVIDSLRLAKQHAPTIWKFRLIQNVFRMLTSSGKNDGIVGAIAKGAIRQAWIFGTAGMMPAILNGRSLVEAVKRSVEFLKTVPVKLIALIFVKQAIAGILALGTAGIAYVTYITSFLPLLLLIIPFIIMILLIQPIYISMLYKLYVEFLRDKSYAVEVNDSQDHSAFTTWVIGIYVFSTAVIFFLGIV